MREGSTREDSFQLVSIFTALTLQLLSTQSVFNVMFTFVAF